MDVFEDAGLFLVYEYKVSIHGNITLSITG